MTVAADDLQRLRADIQRLERGGAMTKDTRFPLAIGAAEIDAALPGGGLRPARGVGRLCYRGSGGVRICCRCVGARHCDDDGAGAVVFGAYRWRFVCTGLGQLRHCAGPRVGGATERYRRDLLGDGRRPA
jgi:hypothetical protein